MRAFGVVVEAIDVDATRGEVIGMPFKELHQVEWLHGAQQTRVREVAEDPMFQPSSVRTRTTSSADGGVRESTAVRPCQ